MFFFMCSENMLRDSYLIIWNDCVIFALLINQTSEAVDAQQQETQSPLAIILSHQLVSYIQPFIFCQFLYFSNHAFLRLPM